MRKEAIKNRLHLRMLTSTLSVCFVLLLEVSGPNASPLNQQGVGSREKRFRIADFELRIWGRRKANDGSVIRNSQFAIRNSHFSPPSRQRNYRVLGADNKRVAIVNAKGEVEWEVANEAREVHDIAMLPNGNVLFQTSYTTIVEMSPDKKTVWQYESKAKAGYVGRIEIHSYVRLKNGLTMIAESGNARIVEVDKNGNIVREIPLTVEKPNPHRDTRMVRKLDNGNYLVCHEGDGKVREYDRNGKVVWSYSLDLNGRPRSPGHGPEGHGMEVFGAVRLLNGNTMIAGGNNNRVLEVTPAGKVVWSIDQKEVPGITLAWVTTLQVLPNGNLIVGNTHAGPDNPQLFEVTRDKRVVWTFKDFKTFGNSLVAAQVLGLGSKVIR